MRFGRLGNTVTQGQRETETIDAARLERRRRTTEKSRAKADKQAYFQSIASARYVLRKVFRIVEERAKAFDIHPLAHQALIQLYGSPEGCLRVKDVAERLDIVPAFASTLIRSLLSKGLATRNRGDVDQRETLIRVSKSGIKVLIEIDESVQADVERFTKTLSTEQKELAVSVLLFYVGSTLSAPSERT